MSPLDIVSHDPHPGDMHGHEYRVTHRAVAGSWRFVCGQQWSEAHDARFIPTPHACPHGSVLYVSLFTEADQRFRAEFNTKLNAAFTLYGSIPHCYCENRTQYVSKCRTCWSGQ